jgi:succinate dehydrogenase/fumarate reductase flavoprotein subunit
MTTVTVPSTYMYKSGAILINKRGERFTDELKNPSDQPIPVLAGQPDELAYVLLDAKIAKKFSKWPYYVSTAPGIAYAYIPDYRRTRKDIFHEAPTLAALAAKVGIPAAQLEKTVADFNRELPSRPAAADLKPLDQGPYIAMGPVRHYMNFADSGVAVDHRLQVLGPGDKPIEGLFAAGFIGMGGVILVGHGHHLGWTFTSGRFAGRHAAHRVVTEDYVPPDSTHHYQ